jgi:hypothetical protein
MTTAAVQAPSADAERPVIFLDIDGVLNRPYDKAHSKDHVVRKDLLARLNSLIASTKSRPVLTSTWRHEPGGLQKARDLQVPFEDVLPDLRPRSRGDEIRAWLADHPEVRRFVIIDDDDDEYQDMPLFQPNPYHGLSDRVTTAIKQYLVGERKNDYRRSALVRATQYLKSFFEGHRG